MRGRSPGGLVSGVVAGVPVAIAAGGALAVLSLWLVEGAPAGAAGLVAVAAVTVVTAVFGVVVAGASARRIEAPLRALAASAERAGPGRPLGALPARTPDALGDLASALERYGHGLEASLEQHRAARREAEREEAYESEFLSTISHELRTPLNAILGFSQVLLDEIDGELTLGQREDVHTIRASGEHLRDLVSEVLDLAAMQSGRFSLELEPTAVEPILRDVGRLLEGQRRAKDVSIELDLGAALPPVAADPRRLRQIATNLGTNALKFTDSGSVRIEARLDPRGVRLTVRDTGAGIRREDLTTIFDEFTQVGDVRRKSQGSGLGLAICKKLVELHEGTIEVESVVGEGSVFHVVLPLWSAP